MNSGPPHNTPADMALAFAGEPDGPVLAHLHAVMGEKRQIEAGGPASRV